jgi:GH15 family glucan-1,4-alpha-glucosidase
MSWAGCDRLGRIAASLGLDERAAHWRRHAARIRERVLEHAWNPQIRALTSSLGGSDLDATALLCKLGFCRGRRFLHARRHRARVAHR